MLHAEPYAFFAKNAAIIEKETTLKSKINNPKKVLMTQLEYLKLIEKNKKT